MKVTQNPPALHAGLCVATRRQTEYRRSHEKKQQGKECVSRILIVVPARLSSRRLPRKVLLPVAGKPLLLWSCESAERGRRLLCKRGEDATLLVACAEQEIVDCAEQHGFSAVLTDADLPSGSDRVWQAVQRFDPRGEAEIVVNCQADLPIVEPSVFQDAVEALRTSGADIATPIVAIGREQAERSSVVKAIVAGLEGDELKHGEGKKEGEGGRSSRSSRRSSYRVLAFTRACAPWSEGAKEGAKEGIGDACYWHHIGLYVYRRDSLSRFVLLAPSSLERREGLEQMRALEAGMKIVAFVCASAPIEINLEDERVAFERRVLAGEVVGVGDEDGLGGG